MCYEIERFTENDTAKLFLCSICQKVLCCPRKGKNLPTSKQEPTRKGHKFCECCIKNVLSSTNRCPVCENSLSETHLEELDEALLTLLKRLKLACKYYYNGCQHTDELESIEQHEATCEYACYACQVCGLSIPVSVDHREVDCLKNQLTTLNKIISQKDNEIEAFKNDYNNLKEENRKLKMETNGSNNKSNNSLNKSIIERSMSQDRSPCNRGIDNVRNSCFMSAIYQSLAHIPKFKEICLEPNTNAKLFSLIAELVLALWDNDKTPVKPSRLNEFLNGRCALFDFHQHDANEFLLYLLNNMNEELRDRISESTFRNSMTESNNPEEVWENFLESNKSPIAKLFFGIVTITYECLSVSCKKNSYKHEPVSFIDLPVPYDAKEISVIECIKAEYKYKMQTLKMNCRYCLFHSVRMSKTIAHFPIITIMRLNRQTRSNIQNMKTDVSVKVSEIIQTDKDESLNLQCVVNHKGFSLNAGHYTTHALNHNDSKWYCYDDNIVTMLPSNWINKYTEYKDSYILFYCKI